MPPEPDGWLRDYLDAIHAEVRHMRTQLDAFKSNIEQRLTKLETQRARQTQEGFAAPHWALVGITAASILWSMIWTFVH